MIVPQKQSVTFTIRRLCEEIQTQINVLIKRSANQPSTHTNRLTGELTKTQFQRIMQELKSALVQVLTSRLPALINFEQSINESMEDLTDERDEWRDKYKKIFKQFQQNQLQNDKLKIQVIALSESYEQLSINFEEMKYKYHELQEKDNEGRRTMQRGIYLQKLNQLNLLSKDSGTNSASSDRQHNNRQNQSIKVTTEMMLYQKEMFLQEIRSSQKEIFAFKNKIEELIQDQERLEQENNELEQLLKGQKVRSDKFDREILDILNKNQELKLEALQQKQLSIKSQEECQRYANKLKAEKQRYDQMNTQKQEVGKQLAQEKQIVAHLKLENSQIREAFSSSQQKQREMKAKINEMKKQNEQLRNQLQKIIKKLNDTTETLQRTKQEQIIKYRHQLQEQRNKTNLLERQSKVKSHDKMQEISKMHKQITYKLQQKIHLLQKGNKDKKQKAAQLKYEVERLYESLQIQVQKQFKSNQIIKQITEKLGQSEKLLKATGQKLEKSQEAKERLQQLNKSAKFQLHKTTTKLKKIVQINTKISTFTLPRLKQQLHSTKLLCQHFCAMIEMQKQQTSFLLTKKQQHFKQLIEQTLLHKNISKEQATLAHHNEIAKWKDNCKNYEEKYDRLKDTFDHLQEKHQKLQILYEETLKTYTDKVQNVQQELQRKKLDQASTLKTIQKLKEKCKQVEQYYKLIEDLSKQNMHLKSKLETASYYSFKSPQKVQLDNTSKRQKFTEQGLQRYNKTTNIGRIPQRGDDINMNDLTAKAEFQKLRLQAARREYNLINRPEN